MSSSVPPSSCRKEVQKDVRTGTEEEHLRADFYTRTHVKQTNAAAANVWPCSCCSSCSIQPGRMSSSSCRRKADSGETACTNSCNCLEAAVNLLQERSRCNRVTHSKKTLFSFIMLWLDVIRGDIKAVATKLLHRTSCCQHASLSPRVRHLNRRAHAHSSR